MESGNHTLQRTIVSNNIQAFLIVIFPMKYGK